MFVTISQRAFLRSVRDERSSNVRNEATVQNSSFERA
jgi:hypothetical protein